MGHETKGENKHQSGRGLGGKGGQLEWKGGMRGGSECGKNTLYIAMKLSENTLNFKNLRV